MVRRRRGKDDDYIGPAKGWAKFFHRLFLFVTFPIRKPWWFLLIVLILFLAPTFRGVKPAEVHLWYWNLIRNSGDQVADKAKEAVAEIPTIDIKKVLPEPKAPKISKMVPKSSGRKVFARSKTAPIVVVKTEPKVEISGKKANVSENVATPTKLITKKDSVLRYLVEPELISGKGVVVNANELKVGETEMFLFGVYVNPLSEKGKQAKDYLQKLVAEKTLDCQIIAYTYQNIATAKCLINNMNINDELVRLGYSKKVAVD